MKTRFFRTAVAAAFGWLALVQYDSAAPITAEQASNAVLRAVVRQYPAAAEDKTPFATPFGLSKRNVRRVGAVTHRGETVGHAVVLDPGGYYLLSADDDLPPWKLRSEDGDFDGLPPALLSVLASELAEDRHVLQEMKKAGKSADAKYRKQWDAWRASAPENNDGGTPPTEAAGVYLLSTAWNQNSPYNYYCPVATGGPGGRAYAGCNAAAASQILKYHAQPAAVRQNHTYTDSDGACTGTFSISDAGLTVYDWANMPVSIMAASPTAQQQAIGKLIYHIAVALDSDFEGDGTSAYPSDIPSVLSTYFGYTTGSIQNKSSFTGTAWYNKIAADVDANKPVFYGMWQADGSAGHSVVCDGYRNGNEIHLNIGWGTSYNAWYNMDSVVAGSYTWTKHSAVFQITPPTDVLPNDVCSGAAVLANGIAVSLNTSAATSTGDPVPGCGTSVGKGVWYQVTPADNVTMTITTCGSSFDTVLAVYTGACGALVPLVCDDNSGCSNNASAVTFSATAGTTYRVLAGGCNGAGGSLQIAATWTVPPPANDQCSGAVLLTNGVSVVLSTTNATSTGDPALVCDMPVGNGLWYKVVPSESAVVTVATCGSSFDTVLGVYTGACGSQTQITCDDDSGPSCSGINASASFAASAGTTYYIFIAGYSGYTGNLQVTATWTAAAFPDFAIHSIAMNPSSPSPGQVVTATVVVTNRGTASGTGGWLDCWGNNASSQSCGALGDAYRQIGVLAPGASLATNLVFVAPTNAAAPWTFRAFIDSACATAESNEANNQAVFSYGGGLPDLAIHSITLNPASPSPGQVVTATVVVTNRGTLSGTGGWLDCWANNASSQSCGAVGTAFDYVGTLAAGSSVAADISFTAPTNAAAPWTFRAFIDSTCAAAESNEANNQTTLAYGQEQPPTLGVVLSASNIILSWPTNSQGFTLWTASNMPPSGWTDTGITPGVVNQRFVVTNPVSGPAKFYRLGK